MRVSLPHTLGREEVRRRFHARAPDLAGAFPAGMAEVTQRWADEDHLVMEIRALGQVLSGEVVIEDQAVVVTLDLPPALGFVGGMIESAVRQKGTKLLAP